MESLEANSPCPACGSEKVGLKKVGDEILSVCDDCGFGTSPRRHATIVATVATAGAGSTKTNG